MHHRNKVVERNNFYLKNHCNARVTTCMICRAPKYAILNVPYAINEYLFSICKDFGDSIHHLKFVVVFMGVVFLLLGERGSVFYQYCINSYKNPFSS